LPSGGSKIADCLYVNPQFRTKFIGELLSLGLIAVVSDMRPWLPQPQMVAVFEPGRARCLAATPVAAPVRWIVISIESIRANG
jgi:hypothetical protein